MRWISFSEYEFGVLAIGAKPFGILAFGGFPVGVVAVGVVPMGLVSLACGASLGVINYTCGVGVGGYVRAIGVAIGGDAFAVGLPLGLAGELPEVEDPLRETLPLDEALQTAGTHWVLSSVDRAGELEGLAAIRWTSESERAAQRLRGRAVYAQLEVSPPAPPPADHYRRSAQPEREPARCLALEDATARRPRGALMSYGLRLGLAVVLVLGLLFHFTRERVALTHMTRTTEATWQARPAKAQGLYLAPDSSCVARAAMRSDGVARLHVNLALHCGDLVLFERQLRSGCELHQRASDGAHRYQLRCAAKRVPRRVDDDGDVHPEKPGLTFDTLGEPATARIHARGPPPMDVTLTLDAVSDPSSAPALLVGRSQLRTE